MTVYADKILLKWPFVAGTNFFFTKNVIFCRFFKKSTFLVKFDIKNGFSDSFPFQKCILLYTSLLQFKSYDAVYFSHFYGLTPTLTEQYRHQFYPNLSKTNRLYQIYLIYQIYRVPPLVYRLYREHIIYIVHIRYIATSSTQVPAEHIVYIANIPFISFISDISDISDMSQRILPNSQQKISFISRTCHLYRSYQIYLIYQIYCN